MHFYTKNNTETFVLNPFTCHSFFACDPSEADSALRASDWVDGHYQSATVDENNNLVLVLSHDDIEAWKESISIRLDRYQVILEDKNNYLTVSDDYTKVVVGTKKELYVWAGYYELRTVLLCGIMQMLEGNDPNEWNVHIVFEDVETHMIVKEADFPKDGPFNLNSNDWDAVLNNQ